MIKQFFNPLEPNLILFVLVCLRFAKGSSGFSFSTPIKKASGYEPEANGEERAMFFDSAFFFSKPSKEESER